MKAPLNAGFWKRRAELRCERCHGALQSFGDGFRCQNCGHQYVKQSQQTLGPVLTREGHPYEQPNTQPPELRPGVGEHSIPVNTLAGAPNYQQPNVEAPIDVKKDSVVAVPPVTKDSQDNYQQPSTDLRKDLPETAPRVICPSLLEHAEHYQQPNIEAPAVKLEEPVKIPVYVPRAVGNVQQAGTGNPEPKPGVGIHVPHLNPMGL